MIDTHTHLYFDWYDEDRDKVIENMIHSGVQAAISVGIDLKSCHTVIQQTKDFPFIYGACGIHPNDSEKAKEKDVETIEDLISRNPKIIAVGEVGLDYYRDYADKEIQKTMFRKMISLARKKNLPLIIHNRAADEDIYDVLVDEKADSIGGVFHCFGGDVGMAKKILDMKFYISFTGNVTFKNFKQRDVVKYVPLERLLLETDSPFLSPVPFRGKRNEPAHLTYVAEEIAEIKKTTVEEVIKKTNKNAFDLFGITI